MRIPFLPVLLLGTMLTGCNMIEDNMQVKDSEHGGTRNVGSKNGQVEIMQTETDREREEMMDSDYFGPSRDYGNNHNYKSSDPYEEPSGEDKSSFEIDAELPKRDKERMRGTFN